MDLKGLTSVDTGVLVIGSGAAGLRAAIEARKSGADVLLASKSPPGLGNNTAIARGIMNAVTAGGVAEDSPELHMRDTVVGGRFLSNQDLVRAVVEGAVHEVSELESFGVKFATDGRQTGAAAPGHTYPRVHVCEGSIGTGYTLPLYDYAQRAGVRFLDGVTITKLLKTGDTVTGAVGLGEEGDLFALGARATILAAGGLGQVYMRTNNTAGATGDGYVLAYDVGARLQDMEFVQFYPTGLGQEAEAWGILYETLIQLPGAAIRNALGENILERHDLRSLSRDKLTRVIVLEVAAGRGIEGTLAFDLTAVSEDEVRKAYTASYGPRPRESMIFPVAPTAHFTMGGVMVDPTCDTGTPGLYAAGEVCGGVHGANRLSGNALTSCFVTGAIAGRQAAQSALSQGSAEVDDHQVSAEETRLRALASLRGTERVADLRTALKLAMWDGVGILRDGKGLTAALDKLQAIGEQLPRVSVNSFRELRQVIAVGNMVTVSEMVARAALLRVEARGAHYRIDHPEENDSDWLRNIMIARDGERMSLRPVSVGPVPVAP